MKRLRLVALLLAVATMAAVSLTVASPASADTQGPIRNAGNGKCLTPVGLFQGAAVVQNPCDIDSNGNVINRAQQWDAVCVDASCPPFHVRNHANEGLCLDARGFATNGTPIQLWTCNSISNENWDYGPSPDPLDPYFMLRSRVSGTTSHCLDVPGGSDADGVAMQLYWCNGSPAQTWIAGPGTIE